MSKITSCCFIRFFWFFFLLQWFPGSAGSSPSLSFKSEAEAASHSTSKKAVGLTVALVCLGILATVAFCVLLFKVWQKKRREAQQARLLKLFEEDDELEVELGIRD